MYSRVEEEVITEEGRTRERKGERERMGCVQIACFSISGRDSDSGSYRYLLNNSFIIYIYIRNHLVIK